jgi:hypothetical protein
VDDETPRQLAERTGKHYCVRCLAEVTVDVYLRNDFLCDACAEKDEYPLQSTPSRDEG